MVGFVITPPFAYQSIERLGTLGGAILNSPDIEKCGSFIFGVGISRLKKLLILSIIPLTKSATAVSFSLNQFFIPSSAPFTAFPAAFIP